ncbi:MAG: RagB/SusD family nutrient uptake outer membrane protein [Algibacter sp.]|uniref:RagB/SusD family nutrient uptake outer membrane protein n=1 Tax=Algibacter sp. TaxID=1872428 RepID=UPI003296EA91
MIKFIKYIKVLTVLLLCGSCSDYLDVVPDNTVEVEHLFETEIKAYNALAACYSFIPYNDDVNSNMLLAGDEFIGRLDADYAGNSGRLRGSKIMRAGWQTANDPLMNYWSGRNGGTGLYDGIRVCNTFLENIGSVPDMTDNDKADWAAQVKFLKAYYHFYLLNKYGPIIIADENILASDGIDVVRQYRQSVDVCFDYIINLLDEAIADISEVRSISFLGQIDKTIAMSVKAKVLMYAASPLYNGNTEFYGSFLDENGNPYFNLEADPEKWKLALDATEEAIAQALSQGKKLYIFEDQVKDFDVADWDESGIIKPVYNNKFSIVEEWNSELIWGLSNINDRSGSGFQVATNMRSPLDPANTRNAWQWLGASYRMTEMFYTKNGVPLEEDLTFDYDNRLAITVIPEEEDYYKGFLQPLERTVSLHLDREPRFYAWLATDRGVWRAQDERNNLKMRNAEFPGGRAHATDFYWSGVGVKKFVHPETTSDSWTTVIHYAKPIMRMAELYLMRAEARNEYSGPSQQVYSDLNVIRRRAGLPDVEVVYSNAEIVSTVGKHLDKSGLRDIIQQERLIELSFEGHRYDDIRRWKRASEFFTLPILGWDVFKSLTTEFYTLQTKQTRQWITPRDYFFPLELNELRLNPKLIQNPGWDR